MRSVEGSGTPVRTGAAAALDSTRAVLVDLDGTLVDSERLKAMALARTCGSFGAHVEPAAYGEVMGKGWEEVRGHICARGAIRPDASDFDRRFRGHYEELLREEVITVTEGFGAFRSLCAARGVRLALVTAAPAWQVRFVLGKVVLDGAFERIVTREDVSSHKPDPECYLLALRALGVEAGAALVVEDTHAGLRAGLAARCRVVVIRHEWNGGHDFADAHAIARDFRDLLPPG